MTHPLGLLSGLRAILARRRCPVCGAPLSLDCSRAICDELAADWGLSGAERAYFDYREGCLCRGCGASSRSRAMADGILRAVRDSGRGIAGSLGELAARPPEGIVAAEVNACGNLHGYLARAMTVSYSEFAPADPAVASEDVMGLSYPDAAFDLVLHSDVLEHVPDHRRAIAETARVTRPGGHVVFTAPVLLGRRTRTRSVLDADGRRRDMLPPSYHGQYAERRPDYLVFHEFGGDLLDDLTAHFDVEMPRAPWPWAAHPAVFVCRRKDGA